MNVGFLYIKNTPISTEIRETLIRKGIELFELPLEEKLNIEMANSKHFLGYARLGAEITAMKPDYREQFDVSRKYCLVVQVLIQCSLQQKSQHLAQTNLSGTI